MLTNNEINDIIKVMRSLVNKGILSKETTININNQEGGFLNFLSSVKNRCSYSKGNFCFRHYNIYNFKQRNGRYHENS